MLESHLQMQFGWNERDDRVGQVGCSSSTMLSKSNVNAHADPDTRVAHWDGPRTNDL
jgi:hypothetical protein